jgi:plastocyanin
MNERMRPLPRGILPFLLLMLMTAIAACGSNAGEEAATSNAAAGTNAESSNEASGANADAAPAEPVAEPAPEEPTPVAEEGPSPAAAEPEAVPAAEEPALAAPNTPEAHDSGHAEEQPAEKPAPAAAEPAPAPEKTPAAEEQPAAEAEGKLHVVEIVDFAFAPATLTIAKGDRISFINKDAVGHTATADDESFDTKMLDQDEAAEIVFDATGEFGYYCLPHPGMRGTIIVQ